jgi:hypothetical protein
MLDTKIYCTALDHFSFDSSQIFFGPDNYWHVTAMAFGDFLDDNKITKELIIAFSNHAFNHTTIYKTDDPVINGIGTIIYDPGSPSEYFISSIVAANFRESLHPLTSVDDGHLSNINLGVNNYFLFQNFPNPFNPSTKIKFSMPASSFVTLEVFNTLGEKIDILVSKELSAGTYSYDWNASKLPSGIYFYQLRIKGFVQTKKMLLVK